MVSVRPTEANSPIFPRFAPYQPETREGRSVAGRPGIRFDLIETATRDAVFRRGSRMAGMSGTGHANGRIPSPEGHFRLKAFPAMSPGLFRLKRTSLRAVRGQEIDREYLVHLLIFDQQDIKRREILPGPGLGRRGRIVDYLSGHLKGNGDIKRAPFPNNVRQPCSFSLRSPVSHTQRAAQAPCWLAK